MPHERTIEVACAMCAVPFQVIPSRFKHGRGKHCSPACQYAARRAAPKASVELECIGCGATFTKYPSHATGVGGRGKFCTRECRDQNWVGANNPNWINGDGVYKRGPHWHSIRRRIVARDGNACTACEATGVLHVHHKTPFRKFTCEDEANADSNLVTLCPPCHRRADAEILRNERVAA